MKYRGPRWPRHHRCRTCGNHTRPLHWVALVGDWFCYEHREQMPDEQANVLVAEIEQELTSGE